MQLANDKTWRIRLSVVHFLPKMAKYIDQETFSSKIETTLINMLTDPVFTIREETANSLVQLSKSIYN